MLQNPFLKPHMATLCHYPNSALISSHKFSPFSALPLPNVHFPYHLQCRSRVSAASSKNRRGNREMSNADLCNEIRKFLSSAGLPENHVPSIKELSQSGRQDLANVVRRRGYKHIRQLLDDSITADTNVSSVNTSGVSENENLDVLSNDSSSYTIQKVDISDQRSFSVESKTLSLQEKVARFIQCGELDLIEDHVSEIGYTDESGHHGLPENASDHPQQQDLSLTLFSGDEIGTSRNGHLSTKERASDVDDLDAEARKMEHLAEIRRLKVLLYQKERELEQLKQQIEKEKPALTVLQNKAETEINNVQKLISEKETQLQAAEESLSGLKEVEVLYSGDGKTVELAGSFNGWHEKIKMYSQTPSESRVSELWKAVLWLYPGVYEIKFIVDGEWRIDPHRETTTRNSLQNNVLRVDR